MGARTTQKLATMALSLLINVAAQGQTSNLASPASSRAPSESTAKPKKKILIYTPHGPGMVKMVKDAFRDHHSDVEVDWLYLGAAKLFEKLAEEKSGTQADIIWGGPHYLFIDAAEKNLLHPYRPSWSEVVSSEFHDKDHKWYGDLQTPLSITYNSQMMPPSAAIKDWDDLIDPKYKNRIIVRYPPASGTVRTIYAVLIDRQLRQGKTLDQAFQWLEKLETNTRTYASHSQVMFQKLGEGLFWLSLWNIPEVGTRKTQGYPIDYIYPRSGIPVLLDAIALVNKPNIPEYVRQFYEFATSKKMAEALAAEPHFRIPTRTDLDQKVIPSYLKDPRFKVMPVNWGRLAKDSEIWMQRWEKQIADPQKLKDL